MRRIEAFLERLASGMGALLLAALVAALALNVAARTFALPIVGAGTVAQWAFSILAFVALASMVRGEGSAVGRIAGPVVAGFAILTLTTGLLAAGERVGGVEAVLGWPASWRYLAAAAGAGLAGLVGLAGGWRSLLFAAGAGVALLPLPTLPIAAGIAAFAVAVLCRVPVALALVASVALSPGALSDAAIAQSIMRGLSPYVLLAVPLFILAAALMVAGGIGARIVAAAEWTARRRRSALGEANVLTSLLFGGVSGSSIADVALGARLIVPGMVAAGYPPARAAAITAAAAVLPNVLPPSIALLLAAAATDQSVGALWLAGVGAGLVMTATLWLAVRLTPPRGDPPPSIDAGEAGAAGRRGIDVLLGLLPPAAIAVAVLAGLRLGLVTAVEAGILAVAGAGIFAVAERGIGAVAEAFVDAATQTGRVGLIIGASAPVGFLFATGGIDVASLLPTGSGPVVLLGAVLVSLLVGTVLDVGAAILLFLPVLLPPAVAAGIDPIQATLVITVALLLGGLTPPVGMLVLVAKDITGIDGVYRAVIPYLLALLFAAAILLLAPGATLGLVRLL
ncbi:TRAP transporter large permease subunit [Acuticoccus mangrovi]|uniref:TRAP transporter large permease subunit n=1 Tax=Acuticoccus mangrovi TaxID=2796142 RepID=A0A934IN86_9HYPH|nr:TRAP transporter large permease subunit [Acuticoccus mangrovi]MBJ3774504.1 TRAP transporter large permease subunit [Acuticoccus mangrovi]